MRNPTSAVSAERLLMSNPAAAVSADCLVMSNPISAVSAERLLNYKEVADRYGLTEAYWRKAIEKRRLPVFVIGGNRRLAVEDVEAFLAACRREPIDGGN